jgi:hypothetical protein
MQYITILLGLAAAVSAIDIRLWVSNNRCRDSGAAAVCTAWNPNEVTPFYSVSLSSPWFYDG